MCKKQVRRTGPSNYIPQCMWDVVTCPALNTCSCHTSHHMWGYSIFMCLSYTCHMNLYQLFMIGSWSNAILTLLAILTSNRWEWCHWTSPFNFEWRHSNLLFSREFFPIHLLKHTFEDMTHDMTVVDFQPGGSNLISPSIASWLCGCHFRFHTHWQSEEYHEAEN